MIRFSAAFLFVIPTVVTILYSCSTDVVDEKPLEEEMGDKLTFLKPEEAKTENTFLFRSEEDEQGVIEYMRCTESPDGKHAWVYFSSKNKTEIKLGSREQAGFEVVYFFGKPKELYWIYGSECGFTLSDETREKSQWYGQTEPKCSEDMFE